MTPQSVFISAIEEDGEWPVLGIGLCDTILSSDPNNIEARAYRAALLTLVSEGIISAERKRDYQQSGCKELDATFAATIHMPSRMMTVASIAGIVNALLPDTLGRSDIACRYLGRLRQTAEGDNPPAPLLAMALALRSLLPVAQDGDRMAGRGLNLRLARRVETLWKERAQ